MRSSSVLTLPPTQVRLCLLHTPYFVAWEAVFLLQLRNSASSFPASSSLNATNHTKLKRYLASKLTHPCCSSSNFTSPEQLILQPTDDFSVAVWEYLWGWGTSVHLFLGVQLPFRCPSLQKHCWLVSLQHFGSVCNQCCTAAEANTCVLGKLC